MQKSQHVFTDGVWGAARFLFAGCLVNFILSSFF